MDCTGRKLWRIDGGSYDYADNSYKNRYKFDTGNNSEILSLLQNMQLQENQCYKEEVKWRAAEVQWRTDFQNAQNEKFRLVNAKLDTQEANFDSFSSTATA